MWLMDGTADPWPFLSLLFPVVCIGHRSGLFHALISPGEFGIIGRLLHFHRELNWNWKGQHQLEEQCAMRSWGR